MRDRETLGTIAVVVAVVAMIVVCLLVLKNEHDKQQRCVDSGGIVHEYSCVYVKGARSCSWQCVRPASDVGVVHE